jgi:hypothetical protein
MGITVEQSIPMNARGFFLRERESLQEQFGVQLKFPKGREFMHGTHQTMLMVGRQTNITSIMPQVRRILIEANDQFVAYKERQERRRSIAFRNNSQPMQSSQIASSTQSQPSKARANTFSALEGLFEQETKQHEAVMASRMETDRIRAEKKAMKKRELSAIESGTAPRPVVPHTTKMNFAAMAAKPKAVETPSVMEQSSTPRAVKLRVVPKQVSVSWADMMDDDEEEDWANM